MSLLLFAAVGRGQVGALGSTVQVSIGCGVNFGPANNDGNSPAYGAYLARCRAGISLGFSAGNG
jgi:hypothetical protein